MRKIADQRLQIFVNRTTGSYFLFLQCFSRPSPSTKFHCRYDGNGLCISYSLKAHQVVNAQLAEFNKIIVNGCKNPLAQRNCAFTPTPRPYQDGDELCIAQGDSAFL